MRDLAKNPRPALCGPAHHHGIRSRDIQYGLGLLGRVHITIGHHRNMQAALDLSHGVVFRHALVALLARSAMDGQHGDASILRSQSNAQRIAMRRTPAGAHLERHRHAMRLGGLHHRRDDLQSKPFVLHQRRARPFVANFFGGATHIDINDLRAPVNVVSGGLGHHLRISARNLHRNRRGFTFMVGTPRGLQTGPQVFARCHHLADRIACTE